MEREPPIRNCFWPLETITLQTEGDVPIADMEIIYVRRCIRTLEKETLSVPWLDSGIGTERKFDEIRFADCFPSVQRFREICLVQLNERFTTRTPDSATLVLMVLNPAIDIRSVLGPASADMLQSCSTSAGMRPPRYLRTARQRRHRFLRHHGHVANASDRTTMKKPTVFLFLTTTKSLWVLPCIVPITKNRCTRS